MEFLYLFCFIAGLWRFRVTGRAVNITSVWFLPQDGFPVFYRYFNDKVTWNEAETVCGFHHAELLSVQTNIQMDVARAYLKEIDVTDNVWIGLQKESPEKPFSWTNGEKLLGEGYWTEPMPKTNEKLCAAIDPVFDFRWNSFYCRGPQVASFVCELPVPEWAKRKNGCLITDLPSLTVTLMPEMEVIQLLSDCGLDGTRRIACNGEADREEIIKRLSCDVDAFAITTLSRSTTADTVREINTQQNFWSDKTRRYDGTTKTSSRLIRHRRSENLSVASTTKMYVQVVTNSPPKMRKMTSSATLNASAHAFPHSPYSASVRNAPSTRKPKIVKMKPRKMTQENLVTAQPTEEEKTTLSPVHVTIPLHKDFPLLIVADEKLNESVSSSSSEKPQTALMMENKDFDESFFDPLSEDIFINNPSLMPVEFINVDLIEVDNATNNNTANLTISTILFKTPESVHPSNTEDGNANRNRMPTTENETEKTLNVVEGDYKETDFPQRPNRGRLLIRSNHPPFYPHFLNRVLG